jgi:thiosulfate dehydrogenase [quinone] large subunit
VNTKLRHIPLFLLRIALGWLFFYAGITKLFNPAWSAVGYLQGAKTLSSFYQWLAQPGLVPVINFLNEWGLLLIGVALLVGLFVRLASGAGAVMMLLYYFPVLTFPHIGATAYVVDEHIVYALALLVVAAFQAGRIGGLEKVLPRLPWWAI